MAEAGAYSGNPLAAATAAAAVAAAAPPPRARAPPHEHGRVPAPALPAAHALPRQEPPRQGSRPPHPYANAHHGQHHGPHHGPRSEHQPEPPELAELAGLHGGGGGGGGGGKYDASRYARPAAATQAPARLPTRPPEESPRLPEGGSGLNIQLDRTSGVPIIEQLAEVRVRVRG